MARATDTGTGAVRWLTGTRAGFCCRPVLVHDFLAVLTDANSWDISLLPRLSGVLT